MKEEGFRGFTRGYGPTFAREMPGYFFFFGGYESCRRFLTPIDSCKQELSALSTIIAGGVGGALLWISIFPFDVVKSRLQVGHIDSTTNLSTKPPNTLQMLYRITKYEGVSALYRGLGPTLLRTFPASGALFLAVEWTRKFSHSFLESI